MTSISQYLQLQAAPSLPKSLYRIRRLGTASQHTRKTILDQAEFEIRHAAHDLCGIYFSSVQSFSDFYEARPKIESSPPEDIYRYIKYFWNRLDDSPSLMQCAEAVGLYPTQKFEESDHALRPKVVEKLRQYARVIIPRARMTSVAACLMERFQDQRMWADYSDGGRGFALELQLKSGSARSPQGLDDHSALAHYGNHYDFVHYSNERPVIYDLEALVFHTECTRLVSDQFALGLQMRVPVRDFLRRYYFTKPLDFRDEREWRFARTGVPPGYYPLGAYRLESVLLGHKILPDDKEFIIGLCRKLSVPTKSVRASEKGYHFELDSAP